MLFLEMKTTYKSRDIICHKNTIYSISKDNSKLMNIKQKNVKIPEAKIHGNDKTKLQSWLEILMILSPKLTELKMKMGKSIECLKTMKWWCKINTIIRETHYAYFSKAHVKFTNRDLLLVIKFRLNICKTVEIIYNIVLVQNRTYWKIVIGLKPINREKFVKLKAYHIKKNKSLKWIIYASA